MESQDVTPAKGKAPGYGLLLKGLLGRIGRRQARSIAMSYVLEAAEVAGEGWTNSREATIRSVRLPWQRSASSPATSASRNYRLRDQPKLWIELVVTDGPANASRLAERSRTSYYRNPNVELVAERDITGYDLPGISDPQLFERETVRGSLHGFNRHVSGRVDDVFLQLLASGDGWDWTDVITVATAQAEKVRKLRHHRPSSP